MDGRTWHNLDEKDNAISCKLLGPKIHFSLSFPNENTFGDISPDGKRFLMMKEAAATGKPAAAEAPRKINIVVNWFEELKQRVPVK